MTSQNRIIPYSTQNITAEDIEAVVKVMKSDYLTQGPQVEQFEAEIRTAVGSRGAVAMNSATSALHVACLALGIGYRDIVWTSAITFVASANCALYCGACIDFIDVDLDTCLISIAQLEDKLKRAERDNKLPKAVIVVHMTGASCEMREIHRLSKEYGFFIIEDASHALGGKYRGENVGNCRYSDICVFSFHPVKIITSAEGGVATTNSPELAEKMRRLRSHGITKDRTVFKQEYRGGWQYEQQELGFNYRMSDIHAALGLSQMRRLTEVVERRNALLQRYKECQEGEWYTFLRIPDEVYSSVHLAIIVLKSNKSDIRRSLFERLRMEGIGVQIHYEPVHLQPYFRDLGFSTGDFPVAEEYAKRCISIPLYPELSEVEQDRVIKLLEEYKDV